MHITIEHHGGKFPSFNVSLASKEGAEPFLTIKGARIVDGQNGKFISWPARKDEKTGKFWNHVWANDKFAAAVLEKATAGDDDQAPF